MSCVDTNQYSHLTLNCAASGLFTYSHYAAACLPHIHRTSLQALALHSHGYCIEMSAIHDELRLQPAWLALHTTLCAGQPRGGVRQLLLHDQLSYSSSHEVHCHLAQVAPGILIFK